MERWGFPDVPSTKIALGDALGYGADRLTTRGGAMLIGAYVVFQIASQASFQSLFAGLVPNTMPSGPAGQVYPLAIDLPMPVSAGLVVLFMILGTVLSIVAMRAMYADIDDVPSADHTRRLARTTAVTIVVSIITFAAISIGTVFLILPGIFLAVSLVFAQLAVVLEDAGVIEALQRSWGLARGNRLRLFALGLIIAVVGGIAGGVFGFIGVFFPLVGAVASAIVTSVVTLFGIGVLVGCYRQIAEPGAAETGARGAATGL